MCILKKAVILAIAELLTIGTGWAARAEPTSVKPTQGTCLGILQWFAGGYSLIDPFDAACNIEDGADAAGNVDAGTDEARVLKICPVGSQCEITGSVVLPIKSKDDGGTNITNITAIRRIDYPVTAERQPSDSWINQAIADAKRNPDSCFASNGHAAPWVMAVVKNCGGNIATSDVDPIWQHATCNKRRHTVDWSFPG